MNVSEKLLLAMNRLRQALEKSALAEEEKLAELNALIGKLGRSARKKGPPEKNEVPMNDLAVALMYLRQPPQDASKKSVEVLVNEAIRAVAAEEKRTGKKRGFDSGKNTDQHARRIRRLIKRIEKSGWVSLGERVESYIAAGGFTDLDN